MMKNSTNKLDDASASQAQQVAINSVSDELSFSHKLILLILIGLTRDLPWSVSTNKETDFFDGDLGDFFGQTLSQLAITALPIALMALFLSALPPRSGEKIKMKTLYTFALSSWIAILFWNAAQKGGEKLAAEANLSPLLQAILSAIPAGISETLCQNVIVTPRLLQQKVDKWEAFAQTAGGAVWQWAYFLANKYTQEEDQPAFISKREMIIGVTVAFSVALTTLMMGQTVRQTRQYQATRFKEPATANNTNTDDNTEIMSRAATEEVNPFLINSAEENEGSCLTNVFSTDDDENVNPSSTPNEKTSLLAGPISFYGSKSKSNPSALHTNSFQPTK